MLQNSRLSDFPERYERNGGAAILYGTPLGGGAFRYSNGRSALAAASIGAAKARKRAMLNVFHKDFVGDKRHLRLAANPKRCQR
jgi:hypothetical protein